MEKSKDKPSLPNANTYPYPRIVVPVIRTSSVVIPPDPSPYGHQIERKVFEKQKMRFGEREWFEWKRVS